MRSLVVIGLILTCVLFTPSVRAGGTDVRMYKLPSHGVLELRTPDTWKAEESQGPQGSPAAISFGPREGRPFAFLISPMVLREDQKTDLVAANIRREIERQASQAESQAVAGSVHTSQLIGASGDGFYFTATDRAPKAGEYKYMAFGILRIAAVAVTFTILTNDGQEDVVEQALAVLRTAHHLDGAE